MTVRPLTAAAVADLLAEMRARLGSDAGFDPDPELRKVLQHCSSPDCVLDLANVALDLGSRDVAREALAVSHTPPLRARFAEMWDFTKMPDPQPAVHGAVAGRVAYCLYSSLPYLSTGYAIRSHALARGLIGAGSDMHCITRPGFPWDEPAQSLRRPLPAAVAATESLDGLSYHRLAPLSATWWTDFSTYMHDATQVLVSALQHLRPAVVMAASNYVCALPALHAARKLGLPFVYDMRGMWELSRAAREPEFMASPQFCHERALETLIATEADHVFTLSPRMTTAMVARGVPSGRITYLPNGCDVVDVSPPDPARIENLRARLQIPAGLQVIGFAGSFPAYEGLEDLIAAAALLRDRGQDFCLVLVGDEGGTGLHGVSRRQVLEEQIAGLGLCSRVILTGRIDPASVRDFLDLFDLMVVPRRSLAVTELVAPLKTAEAMAAGKALIVSAVGGMVGLIENGVTGLIFSPGDITDLANTMGRLVADPGLRHRLGKAAQAKAQSSFDWREIGKSFRKILSECETRSR
jgi:glycosyltransferase involved in cell wall biosynthesis